MFSVFGSQFTTVAMAWQIYELTNSPLQIGALGLARALPQMGLTLFGGLLADAVDRRRLLMITQIAQFCVSGALVVLTALGEISPGVLYGGAVPLAAVRTGVSFVWTHPILLSFMALDFAQNFFGNPRALLPIFARDILDVGPSGLGMLYSAISIGALVGAAIVARLPRRDQAGW